MSEDDYTEIPIRLVAAIIFVGFVFTTCSLAVNLGSGTAESWNNSRVRFDSVDVGNLDSSRINLKLGREGKGSKKQD